MGSDHRVSYWMKGMPTQNVGDFFSEALFDALTGGRARAAQPLAGFDVIHLVGTVISRHHVRVALEHARFGADRPIAFWGCGWRDEDALPPETRAKCAFLGVRGPLTLAALDLPADTPIGDPGLLAPFLHRPSPQARFAGKSLCIPHYNERRHDKALLAATGCDIVLRPKMPPDPSRIFAFLDAVAAADFVLAGSLHAAVFAHAFGTPYAFFGSGAVDVPFKWTDFAFSVGAPSAFARTLAEGRHVDARRGPPRAIPLAALLRAAPYRAPRELLRRVESADAALPSATPEAVDDAGVDEAIAAACTGADFAFSPSASLVVATAPTPALRDCELAPCGAAGVRLRMSAGDAGLGSSARGYRIPLPPETAAKAAGRRLRVCVALRQRTRLAGTSPGRLGVGFAGAAGDVGERCWMETTGAWQAQEQRCDAPATLAPHDAFVDLLPAPGACDLEIAAIGVFLADRADRQSAS